MPKTSVSHEIDTIGEGIFKRTLSPKDWIVYKMSPDYGIDFKLEIVMDREIRSDECYVQIKSTSKDLSQYEYIHINISRRLFEYWTGKIIPFLIVKIDTVNSVVYYKWLDYKSWYYDEHININTDKVGIAISTKNKMESTTLAKELKNRYKEILKRIQLT